MSVMNTMINHLSKNSESQLKYFFEKINVLGHYKAITLNQKFIHKQIPSVDD